MEKLTREDAAQYLGVKESTLIKWRSLGQGPLSHREPSGRIMYHLHDLEKYVADVEAATIKGGAVVDE